MSLKPLRTVTVQFFERQSGAPALSDKGKAREEKGVPLFRDVDSGICTIHLPTRDKYGEKYGRRAFSVKGVQTQQAIMLGLVKVFVD